MTPWRWLQAGVALIYAALLLPLLVTIAVSFNGGPLSRFPPEQLSLSPWAAAIGPGWAGPMLFSVQMSALCALVTALLGTPMAFALAQRYVAGRRALEALVLGPLLLPGLVTGLAIVQALSLAGWGGALGLPVLVAAHSAVALPILVRMVAIRLAAIPPSLARAAASLGASPMRILARVTMPLLRTGIAGGATFAFIHAFTDVNVSLFLARPGSAPVTIHMLGRVDYGFTPDVAAASVITILVPLALVAVLEWAGLPGLAAHD